MSAMADMSRAIRGALQEHTPEGEKMLAAIPDKALDEFVQIVGAFYMDLRDEQSRRQA